MATKINNLHKKPATAKESKRNNSLSFLLLTGIIIITIIAYSNSLNNKFTNWDDNDYITNNPDIKELSLKSIKHYFEKTSVGMYQPLAETIFSIEYHFAGLNPMVYHFTNLIFHLVNTILVFYLILILSGKISVASFVCLFFAIHPMHVESVAWLSELKDVLYTSLYLGGLVAYIYYLKNHLKFKYIIISFLLFFLSLLSKSAAVTFPVLLLLLDYYYNRKINYKSLIEKIPFFIFSLVFGIVSVITQKTINHSNEYTLSFNLFDKFLMVCYNIVYYIFNLFFPLKLSALHPFPAKIAGFLPLKYYLSPFITALIIWGSIKLSKLSKDGLFAIFFFFITSVLVIQIIPIGKAVVAERYTYISYIGLLFLIAQSYYLLQKNNNKLFNKISNYILISGIFYAIIFVYLTINQNSKWKDSITLWTNVIEKYPDAAFAYNIRGYAFFNNNDNVNAMKDYKIAIELKNDYSDAWFNLATSKLLSQDFNGAIEAFNRTLKIDSLYGDAYFNRGYAKFYGLHDNQGALYDLKTALKYIKNDYMLYFNLGVVQFTVNDYEGAMNAFNNAIKVKNYYPDAWYIKNDYLLYNNLGNVKFALKDYKGAMEDYKFSLNIKPDYAEAYFNLANTEYALNDFKNACKNWNKSNQLGYSEAKIKLNKFCF
jgi:protein O-mannosyl-transferase